jgi:hypothetical protein
MTKQTTTDKATTGHNLGTLKGILLAFATCAKAIQGSRYDSGTTPGPRTLAWDHKRVNAADCTRAALALATMVTDTESGPMVPPAPGKENNRFPGAMLVAGRSTTNNPAGLGYAMLVASVGAGATTVDKGLDVRMVGTSKHIGAGIGNLTRTHGGNPLPSGGLVAHMRQSAKRIVVLTAADGKAMLRMVAKSVLALSADGSDKDTRAGLLALGVQIAADVESFEASTATFTPAD